MSKYTEALLPLRDEHRAAAAAEALAVLVPPDAWADDLCTRMAATFAAPIAFLNVVTEDGTSARGHYGLPVAWRDVAARRSFCSYVAATGRDLEVARPLMRTLLADCAASDSVLYYLGLTVRLRGLAVAAVGVADTAVRDEGGQAVMEKAEPFRSEVERELARRVGLR